MSATVPAELFVLAGLPRTGTTSLFHILGRHPQFCQPYRKEVGYFLFNFDRGRRWLDRVYGHRLPGQLCLDVTPEYCLSGQALDRIVEHDPPVRVALGVRHASALAASLHRELRRRRDDVPDFDSWLDGYGYHRRGTEIRYELGRGALVRAIEDYRRRLGPRLLLYDYDLLLSDPVYVLRCIETFLGLSGHFTPDGFKNLFFNASNRSDSRPISRFLAEEPLIAVLERVMPRRLLLLMARCFYLAMSRGRRAAAGTAGISKTENSLDDEAVKISRVFGAGPVVLGTGDAVVPRSQVRRRLDLIGRF
ncbi:MAG TPA: hypothetical protein VMT85_09560 [Thermoanaerobaculia bacterium]|nr:hypothetical protein [Thermoanaerobaculia bacterium]